MRYNIFLFIYLILSLFIIGALYHFPSTGIDDANIYFVYMKNFANGNGFVYNVGGGKVEGFTSILWTLIGSFIFRFTNHIEICLFIINFTLLFFTLKIALKIIQLCISDNILNANYSILFLGLLLVLPGFYDWTILSLLETGLWTFELMVFTYLLIIPYLNNDFTFQKSSISIALLIPFFVITRPESILLGMVFITIRAIQLFLEKYSYKKIILQILPICIVFVSSLFVLTKWRLYYFGYPFPNTYYVKMSDGFFNNLIEGCIYLIKYTIRTNPLIILFFIVMSIFLFRKIKYKKISTFEKIIFTLIIISLVGIGIPFYTGGDHFRMSRFYQPFSPIFHLCFILLIYLFSNQYQFINKVIYSKKNTLLILLVISIIPFKNLYMLFLNNKHSIVVEFNIAQHDRAFGNQLNSFFHFKNKPSIAVIAAGGIAYTYDGYVNDVLGLNNIEVAHTLGDRPKNILKGHRAFNKFIFLKQHPDLFLSEMVSDTSKYIPFAKRTHIEDAFIGKVIKHIYKDDDFNNQYSAVYITHKKIKQTLFSYASNQFINSMDTAIYTIKKID